MTAKKKQKAKGVCPHCEQRVQARIIEENDVRRDVLACPECDARVLLCASPGCKDYALGGEEWDDFFCPNCMESVRDGAVKLAFTAATTAISVGVAVITKGKITKLKL